MPSFNYDDIRPNSKGDSSSVWDSCLDCVQVLIITTMYAINLLAARV